MKITFKIFLLFFFSFQIKAQELFYQSTYKGGVSYDGKSYYSQSWTVADSIKFQNSAPIGCAIKKAFLISLKESCVTSNTHPAFDLPVSFQYNNHKIQFDTTDNVTPEFYSNTIGVYSQCWMCVKDVTTLTQNNNNVLSIPCQGCNPNVCESYQYDGFYLLLLYENSTYSNVNVALYLNNTSFINPIMNYTLTGLNPINTSNDVGLSIEANCDDEAPYLQYQLTSSTNTVTLGTLRDISLNNANDYNTGMGSFYYQNGVLTGLNGNTNSPLIDSTDALCNIKTYLPNNASTFSLTATTGTLTADLDNNWTDAFVLAYSTPCRSVPSSVDSTKLYKICSGQSIQLNASAGYTSYNWFPSTSLSNTNISNPNVQNAQYTTNYICYVKDAAGCMHTEHAKVIVHQPPSPQSITTTTAICGSTQGTLSITPNHNNYGYTYSLNNGTPQINTTFNNLIAGFYTLTVSDSLNCIYKDTFTIQQINLAQARFYTTPYSGCSPLDITCTNTSNFNSNVTNAQTWYVNGDSATTKNLTYTFIDTGKYVITLLAYETLRSVTVKYCPPDSIHITVPNIFTPNGDSKNDTWQLTIYTYQYTISNYTCTIYDRWGLKLFNTTDSNEGWNGRTTSGVACSADTYFYIIKVTETSSQGVTKQEEFKGFLELIK